MQCHHDRITFKENAQILETKVVDGSPKMQTQIQFAKTQTQINAGTQSETCTQVHEMKKWI